MRRSFSWVALVVAPLPGERSQNTPEVYGYGKSGRSPDGRNRLSIENQLRSLHSTERRLPTFWRTRLRSILHLVDHYGRAAFLPRSCKSTGVFSNK